MSINFWPGKLVSRLLIYKHSQEVELRTNDITPAGNQGKTLTWQDINLDHLSCKTSGSQIK